MKWKSPLNVLVLMLVLAFMATSLYAAERKTRDLVFEEEEEPAAASAAADAGIDDATVISIKTTIELTRDGQTSLVLPTEEFKSGDKVRFIYTTNADGYVYWLAEGSTGSYQMLYPHPKISLDNAVAMNEEYTFPTKGHFKFDENPGSENILVIISPNPIPELDEAVKTAAKEQVNQEVASVQDTNQSKRQTRDLVFEEEEDEDTGVSTKSQASADPGEPFVAYYELKHM